MSGCQWLDDLLLVMPAKLSPATIHQLHRVAKIVSPLTAVTVGTNKSLAVISRVAAHLHLLQVVTYSDRYAEERLIITNSQPNLSATSNFP